MKVLLAMAVYPAMLVQVGALTPPIPGFAGSTTLPALAASCGLMPGSLSIVLAAAIGLLHDLLSSGIPGPGMLISTLTAFAVQQFRAEDQSQGVPMTVTLFFAGTFMICVVAATLVHVLNPRPASPDVLQTAALGSAFWTGVFSIAAISLRGLKRFAKPSVAKCRTSWWMPS